MKKLTVSDAALELGITKEAIYNRIRRGSLKSVTEGDERYIVIDDNIMPQSDKQAKTAAAFNAKTKSLVPDERYINLLIAQINELKSANSELNKDKERLIREKEQLLIEQRVALETIYKERDEQLKAILTLANRSLLANSKQNDEKLTIEAEPLPNSEFEIDSLQDKSDFTDWRELKSYLKAKGFSKKKKKKIVSHAKEFIGVDGDVQEDDGVLYVKKEKIERFI